LFHAADLLLPPVIAGITIAAVLSAIMSTADSQLLVAASSVAYDWRIKKVRQNEALVLTRWVVVMLSLLAMALAIFAPDTIFRRVLFAWHAVGSAFGPLVILRVLNIRVREKFILATLLTGFGLTVFLYSLPDTPGDIAERLLPFAVAMVVAIAGRRRVL
jgi:sodium/proline symporter